MRSQIEAWSLEVIDAVVSGKRKEDSQVELKAEWQPPEKMARQLAGHANAARGQKLLWLIGVDEDSGTVREVEPEELSNRWSQVLKCFADGVAPDVQNVGIQHGDVPVIALQFTTDRSPYVVKNPAFGSQKGEGVALEVPWREMNSTRTARRNELLRMLRPAQDLPEVEVIKMFFRAKYGLDAARGARIAPTSFGLCEFEAEIFVVPRSLHLPTVFPMHSSFAYVSIQLAEGNESYSGDIVERVRGQHHMTTQNLAFHEPAYRKAEASVTLPGHHPNSMPASIQAHLVLSPTGQDEQIEITRTLARTSEFGYEFVAQLRKEYFSAEIRRTE